MRERSDALAIRASIDDPEAFAEVFERHYDQVRRFSQRALGLDLGEEVAAKTFLAAFEQRASYKESYPSAKPWLMGICQNLIRREFRTMRTSPEHLDRSEETTEHANESVERLDASRLAPILVTALSRLAENDRAVFLLRAVGDLSYTEISEALGIPEGTVRSRIHRAREQLRELIAPEEAISDVDPGERATDDPGGIEP